MSEETITLHLPAVLYAKLQALADESDSTPEDLLTTLVEEALYRRAWLRDLDELRQEIKQDDNQETETSQEQLIEQLRKVRREIFEAEYAHLYR